MIKIPARPTSRDSLRRVLIRLKPDATYKRDQSPLYIPLVSDGDEGIGKGIRGRGPLMNPGERECCEPPGSGRQHREKELRR